MTRQPEPPFWTASDGSGLGCGHAQIQVCGPWQVKEMAGSAELPVLAPGKSHRVTVCQDQRMSSRLIPAGLGRWRPGAATLLGTSLVITAVWTLTGSLLCADTYEMSLQPPENPADAAPFPATLWYPVLLLTGILSLALAPSPAVVLVTGMTYLRRVRLISWRWQAALAGAAAAGAVAEALLLRAIFWYPSGSSLRRPNWGPPALSAGFIAAGLVMIGMLAVAAHAAAGRTPAQTVASR